MNAPNTSHSTRPMPLRGGAAAIALALAAGIIACDDKEPTGIGEFAQQGPSAAQGGGDMSQSVGAQSTISDAFRPCDFDGDGKSDFAVWDLGGNWKVIRSSDNTTVIRQWGTQGDIPTPGYFDGDLPIPEGGVPVESTRKADFAVWRPSEGRWYVIRSLDGGIDGRQWGTQGDIPTPGDYDGDLKIDFAVWRPSDGTWYVIRSSDGRVDARQWGTRGDIPTPGYFDGDGRADFAVWRPSDGTWYVIRSSDGRVDARQWGTRGDIPTPGDYDGDGRADFAVWRPSDGTWYVIRSSDNRNVIQQWGAVADYPNTAPYDYNSDDPTPGDYDGDGRTDFAVYRPSERRWYVLRSSDGRVDGQQGEYGTPVCSAKEKYRRLTVKVGG